MALLPACDDSAAGGRVRDASAYPPQAIYVLPNLKWLNIHFIKDAKLIREKTKILPENLPYAQAFALLETP